MRARTEEKRQVELEPVLILLFCFCNKIFYLFDRGVFVSFAQGGTVIPCPPFSVFSATFLTCLPALPVVVSGSGRVYAWDWGVGGVDLVL